MDQSYLDNGLQPEEVSFADTETMTEIGRIRYTVWREDNSINEELFPSQSWLDELDSVSRHWIVRDVNGKVIAAARMSLHGELDSSSRDTALWMKIGKPLPLPTCDLGRLVVHKSYRSRGIAQRMNQVRMDAAKAMGSKSVMVTASAGNAKLLKKIGFEDIGETIYFDDRPGVLFYAMQYNFANNSEDSDNSKTVANSLATVCSN